ncbi:hypothetical protein MSAN_00887700 [Mycena sanguinolenta]|uniref:Uncharacterized protein n=1 Tax=Mycena sanguinolenta TaxID=230812 RepID=A0A8H6YSD7_9AGAR|nr:hypothetical protein MSAN_00887700 [Mycena sanguinolenta]
MAETRLPPELERHIFELAATSHSKSIPTLFLVAHRVKIWLEPILYSVVVFSNPLPGHVCFDPVRFSSAVQSPATSQYVRNLYISHEFSHRGFELIFANCSSIQNLALFGGHSGLLPFLSAMPLRRLCTLLRFLFPQSPDFSHPLFSRITHLQLWDNHTGWKYWSGLATLPNLTHLAFGTTRTLAIFQNMLTACSALQALVFTYSRVESGAGLESLAHDVRFVCIPKPPFMSDWQIGARGGDDFWVRAENFIARRSCGEIPRETFVLREEESNAG